MSDSDSGKDSPVECRPRISYRHPKIVDNDKNTKLHYLAAAGDNEGVTHYLEKETKIVDPENYMGWTPLMMACRNGHISTVNLLLSYRANTIKVNKYDINVFHAAVASGNLKLVELILDNLLTGGISRRNLERNFSPISLAILFQHQDILEFLIKKHFEINLTTKITGISPLMFAQAVDNSAAITLLLQNKAETKTKNYLGHTAVDIAFIRQQIKFINPDQKIMVNTSQVDTQQHYEKQNENLINILHGKNLRAQAMLQSAGSNQMPLIVVTPTEFFNSRMGYMASPNQPPPHSVPARKSSNISPFEIPPPPQVTPITPLSFSFPRQAFFPPDFSPCNMPIEYYDTDILNSRINSSTGMVFSPQIMNFLSPRM